MRRRAFVELTALSAIGSPYESLGGLSAARPSSWTDRSAVPVHGPTDLFDVRRFGAKGDGSTDDGAAIGAAIAAAEAKGGTVYFPPGAYGCKTPLALRHPHVTLQGDGPSSRLQLNAGPAASALVRIAASYCGIRNLFLDGNRRALPSASLVEFLGRDLTDLRVEGVVFKDAGIFGLRCQGAGRNQCNRVVVTECVFDNCTYGASFVETDSSDIWIDRCVAQGSLSRIGFTIDRGPRRVWITNCDSATQAFGIAVASAQEVWIVDSCAHDVQGDPTLGTGIHVETTANEAQTRGIFILNCQALNCIHHGIEVLGTGSQPPGAPTADVLIASSMSHHNGRNGIYVEDCHRATIRDCHAYENGFHGLSVYRRTSTCRDIQIEGGRYFNNSQANKADDGSGICVGDDVRNYTVRSLNSYDDQPRPTQRYGLRIIPADVGGIVADIRAFGNAVAGVQFANGKGLSDRFGTAGPVLLIKDSDSTPSVDGVDAIVLAGEVPVVITQFANGVPGQRLCVRAMNSSTSIQHGPNIFLKIGSTQHLKTGDTITLVQFTPGRWDEI